jgi:hypothetical protein
VIPEVARRRFLGSENGESGVQPLLDTPEDRVSKNRAAKKERAVPNREVRLREKGGTSFGGCRRHPGAGSPSSSPPLEKVAGPLLPRREPRLAPIASLLLQGVRRRLSSRRRATQKEQTAHSVSAGELPASSALRGWLASNPLHSALKRASDPFAPYWRPSGGVSEVIPEVARRRFLGSENGESGVQPLLDTPEDRVSKNRAAKKERAVPNREVRLREKGGTSFGYPL